MIFPIPTTKEKYYKAALKVINCFLNLTDYELDIIVTMLNYNIKYLTKDTRARLRELLKSDTATFNNYIKRLKDKKALVESEEGLEVNPNIVNSVSDGEITIKFNVN